MLFLVVTRHLLGLELGTGAVLRESVQLGESLAFRYLGRNPGEWFPQFW